MKKYDFIIIGCGISCLYLLKLIKESNINLKICILEKKPYPGGRIHSINIGSDIIDTGALRFNENHKLLLKLLKEFKIDDIEQLESKINIKLSSDLKNKFNNFLLECKKEKYNRFSFGEVAKNYFTQSEYDKLKLWFGYEQKWNESNCYQLASHLKINYDAKKYYHLKNGLSQIVNALFNNVKNDFDFFFS